MVKKIALISLFAIMIAIAFYQNYFLSKNSNMYISQIQEIEQHIADRSFDTATSESMILFDRWKKIKPKYEIICEHDEVDKIQAAFEEFVVLVSQRNELALTQSALLKYYFDHIINIDSFSFENIF